MTTAYSDIHRDLIEQCKQGSRKAYKQLYELYVGAMYNVAWRMLNSEQEAEDIVQEAFIDAFRRLNSFRYESSFGAWLKRIVINKSINSINKRRPDTENVEDITKYEDADDEPEMDSCNLNVNVVIAAMEQLPEGYRVIFSLYLLEGYDHAEIAEIMGITESTSKSQYLRAKRKIKEILTQQGYKRQT